MPRHFLRMAKQGDDKHTGYLFDVFMRKLQDDFDEPFFGFANFPFVHAPYDPPRPFKEEATPGLSRGSFGLTDFLPWMEETLDIEGVREDRVYEAQTGRGDPQFFANNDWLSEAELDILWSWYCASVKYLDTHIQRLWKWFEDTGHIEDTIFVVLADHGEYFGEHGLLKHMYFHFEEALHVPLLIAGPGVPKNERRSQFVSLVDIFDTICDAAGIAAPNETSGRSVFSDDQRTAVFAENGIRDVPDFYADHMSSSQIKNFERGRKSIRSENALLVLDSEGEVSLYDRPNEQKVTDMDDSRTSELYDRLISTLGDEFTTAEGYGDDLDESVMDNLRELGYME